PRDELLHGRVRHGHRDPRVPRLGRAQPAQLTGADAALKRPRTSGGKSSAGSTSGAGVPRNRRIATAPTTRNDRASAYGRRVITPRSYSVNCSASNRERTTSPVNARTPRA